MVSLLAAIIFAMSCDGYTAAEKYGQDGTLLLCVSLHGVLNFSLLRYLVVRYFPTLMQDMVPCILVTFEKEQIVVWRGKDYKPVEDGYFLPDHESFDDMDGSSSDGSLVCGEEGCDSVDGTRGQQDFYSGDDEE